MLISAACAPFDTPGLRETLESLKRETEQALDIYTPDEVIEQGFDAAAKEKASGLVEAFREYLTQNQARIDALQILYSRPYQQRLTEAMLKDLEKKLRDTRAAWTEDRLWDAYAVTVPGKVRGRSQAGRFADLVFPRSFRPGAAARPRALRRFRERAIRAVAHEEAKWKRRPAA